MTWRQKLILFNGKNENVSFPQKKGLRVFPGILCICGNIVLSLHQWR